MKEINYELVGYCVLIIVLSIYNIRIRVKRGMILNSVSGLHFTFLLFFGIGPLFYSFFGVLRERESPVVITNAMSIVYPYLLIAYGIITIVEYKNRRSIGRLNLVLVKLLKEKVDLNKFNLFLFLLSFFGILFSNTNSEIVVSGAGTIFPVIGNFLFPITILIVYNLSKKDMFSIILFVMLFLLVGYNTFVSAWRSQLIMFIGCILIGWNLKGRINYYIIGLLFSFIIFIILPFQQIKKGDLGSDTDVNLAFSKSLDYTYADRLVVAASFFAERINYGRELGYVYVAMEKKYMPYRDGETYLEVIYQLIPRVLWEEKPSYNTYTNKNIPRILGLVSKVDQNTSWAVNCFAEFMYNYSFKFIIAFVLLLYLLFDYLDKLSQKLRIRSEYSWLLQTTLFFLSLNLVSVIFSSTYFLWTFLVIIILNAFTSLSNSKVPVNRFT